MGAWRYPYRIAHTPRGHKITDPNPITFLTQLQPTIAAVERSPSDLVSGIAAIERALPAYRLAKLFAQGDARELFASDTVRAALLNSIGMYRLNVAGSVIRSRTNRMEIAAKRAWSGGADSNAASDLLDDVWDDNELELEVPGFIDKTLTYGDAYIIVWPSAGDDDGDDDGPDKGIDVHINTPETMRAFYHPENPRKIHHAVKMWVTEGDYQRVDIYYDTDTASGLARLERYISTTTTDGVDTWQDENQFRPYDYDGQESTIYHPYGMCVFHARTARPYGRPEHRDAYGPQNAITKLVASHMSSVDWAAFPFRYALSKAGTTGADLNDWAKAAGQAPDPKKTKLDGPVPGRFNKFHDTDSVGELSAADPRTFLEPISQYMRYCASITETPLDKIDSTGRPETGESRRARESSLIKRVDYLSKEIGNTLQRMAAHALKLLGVPEPKVVITWAPSEASDDTAFWDAVKAKENAGVPTSVALTEAGYLEEQVTEWAQSSDDDTLQEKLALIKQIVDAAQVAGQAIQLGSMTPEQAQQLVGQFMPTGPVTAPNELEGLPSAQPPPPAPVMLPPGQPAPDGSNPPPAPPAAAKPTPPAKPKPGKK